jgi:hypothetical protein
MHSCASGELWNRQGPGGESEGRQDIYVSITLEKVINKESWGL